MAGLKSSAITLCFSNISKHQAFCGFDSPIKSVNQIPLILKGYFYKAAGLKFLKTENNINGITINAAAGRKFQGCL